MSPSLRKRGGVIPIPHSSGRSGEDEVAGGAQGGELRNVGQELCRAEHQCAGVPLLHKLAVDVTADVEMFAGFICRDHDRAYRGCAVPGFALEPLQRPVLPVAHGNIIGHGVPGNGLTGLVFIRPVQLGTHDDGELGFPVDAAAAVDFHSVVCSDQGVRVLGEEGGGVFGKLAPHFLDVVTVVQTAADDFAGAGEGAVRGLLRLPR